MENQNTQISTLRQWLDGILFRRKLIIVITLFCSALFPIAIQSFVTPTWESKGLLSLGNISGKPVANSNFATELANNPAFLLSAVSSIQGMGGEESTVAARFLKSFRARPLPSGLVELRARGASPEEAEEFIKLAAATLAKNLDAPIAAMTTMKKKRLAQLEAILDENRTLRKEIVATMVSCKGRRCDNIVSKVTPFLLLPTLQGSIQTAEAEWSQINGELSSPNTMSTSFVYPPMTVPVGVGLLPFVILSLMGGMLGLLTSAVLAICLSRPSNASLQNKATAS